MGWYALFVQSGREERVREELYKRFERSHLDCLIPLRMSRRLILSKSPTKKSSCFWS
ncbi:transcription termination/antitermination NusG family protein [Paenibacillus sp. S-38]|uniref:transcription termination/antitermination NusG family protein n=1 Tax=Paenibacillus sp. S-38 TaxID=3416710 RepID=UPI003CF9B3B3